MRIYFLVVKLNKDNIHINIIYFYMKNCKDILFKEARTTVKENEAHILMSNLC